MKKGLKYLFGGLTILFLAWFILTGVAGRTVHTSSAQRQLPIYAVHTDEKTVSLGINCAWDDADIAPMLAVLEEKGVKATFFLVGNWCAQYPDAAAEIAAAGHELGSHSNTHPDMTRLSREEIAAQLEDSSKTIEQTTGQKIHLFRPPSGAYNDLVVETARALDWEVIQWDCDTLDWKGGDAAQIVQNGTKKLQNGSIILLHAGAKHTLEALPALIDELQGQGYQLVTVGELIYPAPYTIDHTGRQQAGVAPRRTQ